MSEQLSALMDGELAPDEMARQIGALKNNPELSRTWVTYHVLGDALRKTPHLSIDFSDKLAQQLAAEPTILAPQRMRRSNSPRYAMPLAASVAAVSFVGVLAWQMTRVNQASPTALLAAAPVAVQPQAALPKQVALNTPARVQFTRVVSNPYLLAHQEFSPSYAMEGIPAYVRTVTEQQERSR